MASEDDIWPNPFRVVSPRNSVPSGVRSGASEQTDPPNVAQHESRWDLNTHIDNMTAIMLPIIFGQIQNTD